MNGPLPDEVRRVLEDAARRHRLIGAPDQRPANDPIVLKSLVADFDAVLVLDRHGFLKGPLPRDVYDHYFRPAPQVLRRKEPPAPGAGGCGPADPDGRAVLVQIVSEVLAAELPAALDHLLRKRGLA